MHSLSSAFSLYFADPCCCVYIGCSSVRHRTLPKPSSALTLTLLYSGAAGGFLASQLSLRVFKQSRNVALLSGIVAGSAVGYLVVQEALRLNLAKARASSLALRESLRDRDGGVSGGEVAWDLQRREGGAPGTGLETMEDPYRTSSGDH